MSAKKKTKRTKMKGVGFAWIFGVMMVLLVAAVFLTGAVVHYDSQVTIVSRSVEVYDTVHVSEFLKRTLDGACFVNGKAAPQDLALVGGGFTEWTNETPGTNELTGNLGHELERRMDSIVVDGLGGREIRWGAASINLTDYDDNGYSFSGNKSFLVESKVSTPQVLIENQGAFECGIKTSYFKLLRLGLDAAECPPEEGEKTVEDFEQNITAAEDNKYSVRILGDGLELRYMLNCTAAPGEAEEEAAPE